MPDQPNNQEFRLADLIKALGGELREAQRRATTDDQPDMLQLKECTVELAVTWNKKGEAGLEFWVVKLGGEVSRENTQTISVTMEPLGTEASGSDAGPVVMDVAA